MFYLLLYCHQRVFTFLSDTNVQEKLFFGEIDCIQLRHASLFPSEQKRFIVLRNLNGMHKLHFKGGYNLDDVITMEIQLAFKLVFKKMTIEKKT